METAYIALGANVGNREANLRLALSGMTRMARVRSVSALYETAPDPPGQPPFYNAVCAIDTGLEPAGLLRFLKGLEQEIGRRPGGGRFGPRPIDLDILLFGDRVLEEPGLVIPHPRLQERPFVLVPLAGIAAHVVHPVLGETIGELAKAAGTAGVKRIAAIGWDGVAGSAPRVRL